VEGLTTGASILVVSVIGIAVAVNAFILAAGATLLNLLINWGILQLARPGKSRMASGSAQHGSPASGKILPAIWPAACTHQGMLCHVPHAGFWGCRETPD